MIAEAITKILAIGQSVSTDINRRTYAIGPGGITPIKPPKAETLVINTLTGLTDLGLPGEVIIHVLDHKTVNVIDKDYADNWLTRSTHFSAVHESPAYPFGQFYCVEDFIIAIQSMFVQDATTALVLKVVGNVKDEGVSNFCDDGVTQKVTAKTGISVVGSVQVPNPVTLRPYRTFMEIEQPASTFVFRMKGGQGEQPKCALFEADGRMWRLEAIKGIKTWLSEKIPGIKIIA